MSPKKPKEFLYEQKGYFFKGNINSRRDYYKNRKVGIIYLFNTQLRILFKKGGEPIIPLNTIKKLNLVKNRYKILIQTDTDDLYTFEPTDYVKKLYRLLSEVIANLPDGGDVHVTATTTPPDLTRCCCIIVMMIVGLIVGIIYGNLINV